MQDSESTTGTQQDQQELQDSEQLQESTRRVFLAAWAAASVLSASVLSAAALSSPQPLRFSYGSSPECVGDLYLPPKRTGAALPVVVLLHGGFWQDPYKSNLMVPVARDLVSDNIAVWNLEYRRIGSGGGFPFTLADVASGIDWLASHSQEYGLDLERVAVVGHSAGAQLAMWACLRGVALLRPEGERVNDSPVLVKQRNKLTKSLDNMAPLVRPCLVVSAGGVLDLQYANTDPRQERVGGTAVNSLLSASEDSPIHRARLRLTSPVELLLQQDVDIHGTSGDRSVEAKESTRFGLVHGVLDNIVPSEHSKRFIAAASDIGLPCTYREVSNEGHFEVLDAKSRSWAAVRSLLIEARVLLPDGQQ